MRLIDADEAIINFGFEWDDIPPTREEFVRFLKKQLTVDAVPVVYCKDCKYADTERRSAMEKRYADSILFCRNSNLCNDEPLAMWPVDFCSYGTAKECADDES